MMSPSEVKARDVEGALSPVDIAAIFDLRTKKPAKHKKRTKESTIADAGSSLIERTKAREQKPMPDVARYSYEHELLARVMTKLRDNHPELAQRTRQALQPPQLMRVGTRKTLWVNFHETCERLHRNPDHVLQFILTELGTEGSINANHRLLLCGRFIPRYIETLLRKYIAEYVSCLMCRSPSTTLMRDSVSRLHFVHCQACGSSRSVSTIRSGFHAATRADRRAARK